MAKPLPEDIMLPSSGVAGQRPNSSRLAAFIPISFAIAGVAAILLVGVTAREPLGGGIDPVVTGSIKPAPQTGSTAGAPDVR